MNEIIYGKENINEEKFLKLKELVQTEAERRNSIIPGSTTSTNISQGSTLINEGKVDHLVQDFSPDNIQGNYILKNNHAQQIINLLAEIAPYKINKVSQGDFIENLDEYFTIVNDLSLIPSDYIPSETDDSNKKNSGCNIMCLGLCYGTCMTSCNGCTAQNAN